MAILEFAAIPASQAYIANPEIFKPTLDWLAKAPGFIRQWSGLQVEDQKTVYHLIEWETYEHHQNLPSLPNFQELLDLSKPCFAGPPKIYHIPKLTASPDASLGAPVTELCTAKVKSETKNEIVDLVTSLSAQLSSVKGCYGPTFGQTKEEDDTLVLLIGWDAVQTHVDTVKDDEGVKKFISSADLEVVHAPLKKHVL